MCLLKTLNDHTCIWKWGINMKTLLVIIALFTTNTFTYADDNDHPMSQIVGENISLHTKGHTISGKVNDKLIFGYVSTEQGHKNSSLTLNLDDEIISTKFEKINGKWGGMISNSRISKRIEFVKVDKEIPSYTISVDGTEYTVRVEYESFVNNHFVKPTYILELEDKEIEAKMLEGQACWMYSLHLIFMIFGSYLA